MSASSGADARQDQWNVIAAAETARQPSSPSAPWQQPEAHVMGRTDVLCRAFVTIMLGVGLDLWLVVWGAGLVMCLSDRRLRDFLKLLRWPPVGRLEA
jgi:hypothetical protein